jgi:hypothetical protein
MIQQELESQERVILDIDGFVAITPLPRAFRLRYGSCQRTIPAILSAWTWKSAGILP